MHTQRHSATAPIAFAHLVFTFVALALLVSVGQADAREHVAVEVVPQLGFYSAPTSVIYQDFGPDGSITAAHQANLAYGGRLTYWMRPGLGIEGSLLFAPTSLEGQAFGVEGSTAANLFYGAGRVVLGFGQRGGVSRFHLSAGLAYAAPSYDQFEFDSFMAGVIGFGSHLPLGESMALRIDLDDYISTQQWQFGGQATDARVQHDVVMSVGIAFLR